MITIEDPTGPLYDRAHCCLDFVAQCLILHFGLLHLAIEDYDLTAYIPTQQKASKTYPMLMRSYCLKAVSNYSSSVIINYHNHFTSLDEVEEIFIESPSMSGLVLFRKSNTEGKPIWLDNPTTKQMIKDGMYYSFPINKMQTMKPKLWVVGETPHLAWALWNAMALSLEDHFHHYEKEVSMCAWEIGTKRQHLTTFESFSEMDVPQEPRATEDVRLINSQNPHLQIVQWHDALR